MKKIITLFAAIMICNIAVAQIPNHSFEVWDSSAGYKVPVSWGNPDSLTHILSVYPCEWDYPGYSGPNYMKLTSKNTGLGVVPGVAISGKINYTTFGPRSGFANTTRPAALTGAWQYMASGSDQGHIAVLLSKWNTTTNSRDTVSFTDYLLPGMVMSWATFSIPLTYQMGSAPDTAIIVLSASGLIPANNSYLYVDSIGFAGAVPLGVVTTAANNTHAGIYPNPATDKATVSFFSLSGQNATISVSDVSGSIISTLNPPTIKGENHYSLNTSGYAKGMYFVSITNENSSTTQKLIIQ